MVHHTLLPPKQESSPPAMPRGVLLALLSSVLLGDQISTLEDEDGSEYSWNASEGMRIAEARGDLTMFYPGDFGITPTHISQRYRGIDEVYAMTTDLSKPLLFVPFAGQSSPTAESAHLIDGWHRLFKAVVLGIPFLTAYVLTPQEAQSILIAVSPPTPKERHP